MSRLGIYADKIEAIRADRGLNEKGFKTNVTDPAKGDKESMEREMYRRADARLPRGLGGTTPADAGTPDSDED